ncbi:ACT domain-containing protein ACR6-like isoform X2 [Salvia splendens]|uniref:ACT domain-containing protein ACR6-like isoform X2 n=1 Tax=Salvia splendens TaxID=180675 RepID=UPI001C27C164|nr:ACT domain-containing protein ACR6-like isoform X2 [Salvia splendens]
MDDEFAKLIRRINPPRVVIDNESCDDATIIKVDSVKKHGTLLHVVQILTDMNLVIVKGYISSDAGWFMDVFNVVDCNRKKIMDQEVISDIQTKLESNDDSTPSVQGMVGMVPYEEYTCIELTGADRTGLLSEVCAVLADLHCSVVSAELWTHKARAAAVVHITDYSTGCAIGDSKHLSTIKERLCNVLRSNYDTKTAKLTVSPPGLAHRERRLHQMFADQDYEKTEGSIARVVQDKSSNPLVTVSDRTEKGYTVITVRSDDRPKLLFDTICTLTDMQYVVFHGVVRGGTDEAYQVTDVVFSCYPKLQEYYVRCVDGVPVQSEAERQRITQRLETAIERRSSEGLELELCAEDRIGLLPNITRILRENNLYIKRAEISSKGGKARHTFCVTDVSGDEVDPTIVDSIRQQIGKDVLHVKWNSNCSDKQQQGSSSALTLGNLFGNRSFSSFLIGSYS